MKNKKEIAFVVTAMGRGGAERVVSILANYYASINFKVHIIMLWHNISEYELDSRITVHSLAKEGGNPYLKIPSVVLGLRKKIKEIAPFAVVSFIAQNNIISYMATRRLGVRLIVSERIDPASMKRGKFYRAVLNYVYANANVSVLQTKRAFNYFPKKVQKNSVIIYNPISVFCQAREKREKTIVTAGRLEYGKNQQMLIKAFAKFSKRYPDYKLVIYGEGKLRAELEALVHKLSMADKILLPGNMSDVQKREAEAEFFVLSSNIEGMSNALMEAMAIGLPCISTNCSGSDELIINKENGILIDVGDEKALLDAMLYMAEHREEAEKMGQAAREFSKVYATENVIAGWRKAIEEEMA